MRFSRVGCWLSRQAQRGVRYSDTRVKRWTQLPGGHLITGAITDMTRSKAELIAQNAFPRQQLIVLQRQTKRPQLTPWDRAFLVLLASKLRRWRQALLIVKPDTLLRWHRQGFRLLWRRKSRPRAHEPRISPQTIALIKEMAVSNRLWGAKRIRDALRKLDIRMSKRTVQKYMRQARRGLPPHQTRQAWATFLANHAPDIWACDFLQTYDILFRTIFVFFIIELGSRRVVHVGVTRSPTDAWVAQQLREGGGCFCQQTLPRGRHSSWRETSWRQVARVADLTYDGGWYSKSKTSFRIGAEETPVSAEPICQHGSHSRLFLPLAASRPTISTPFRKLA